MFLKKEYQTMKTLVNFFIKEAKRATGYDKATVWSIEEPIILISLSAEGKAAKYLNLFLHEMEDRYYVYSIRKIIGKYTLFELSDNEKEYIWQNGYQLYSYRDMTLSMKDISESSIHDIMSYISDTDSMQDIMIDLSVTEKRKLVSDFIQDYFCLKSLIKDEKIQVCIKDIVDKIAESCQYARHMTRRSISYNEDVGELRATVTLSNENNEQEILYLSLDKENIAFFYMERDDKQWHKKLMPDSIAEVSQLFMKKM